LKESVQARHSIAAEKILVLPSAVDLGLYSPDLNATKKWDLVWTGQMRMDDDKRLEVLISLIEKTGLNLVLVGDGPKRVLLENMAATAGLETHVDFIGWIPYEELPVLLNQASIFYDRPMDPSPKPDRGFELRITGTGIRELPGIRRAGDRPLQRVSGKTLTRCEQRKPFWGSNYIPGCPGTRNNIEQRFGKNQRANRLVEKLLELLEASNDNCQTWI
jgi:hypothetical protein